MPKLPHVKPREIEKVLVKKGFSGRPAKSGHFVFTHPNGQRTVIPGHNRPVRIGTLSAILRQAEISRDEFLVLLKKKK